MREATTQAAAKPFLALTAADLMTTPVMTIPHETSLREAARLLSGSGISGAPVVDADGRCLGVLSSSDFVTRAGEEGVAEGEGGAKTSFIAPWGEVVTVDDSPDAEIRHYMTAQPVAVAPTASIGEMAQKMIDAHIHRLLVVAEEDRPCGIVSSTDILAAVAREARKASLATESKAQKKGRKRP